MKRIALISIASILFFTTFIAIGNTQETEAAFTSKYKISVRGKKVDTKVYVKNGRTFIPIGSLTRALGYTVSYAKLDELFIYHNYDIEGARNRVTVWGNEKWGYSITKRIGKENGPDDVAIYRPVRQCVDETDNCWLIEDLYEGPIAVNDSLYVPIRYMAEAFNLKIKVSKNVINLID